MRTNLLKAIGQGRCPRCREGYMFQYPITSFTKMGKMNRACEKCEATFEPEPGFYFGALYVSYAFTVGIFMLVSGILYFGFHPDEWVYFVAVSISAALFIPISFRYSRILFLYWFGGLQRKDE